MSCVRWGGHCFVPVQRRPLRVGSGHWMKARAKPKVSKLLGTTAQLIWQRCPTRRLYVFSQSNLGPKSAPAQLHRLLKATASVEQRAASVDARPCFRGGYMIYQVIR